ncbi:glutathione/cysteine ABC transporter permease/ATP-binding protein [Actinopolyspora mortivallis]|uniref:Glutathione/cysteine ABC transporter permease/ATP-binding protein n=1 Tax=Actinopolyspora mortivallis TaxID=33906 RepID=A0A2T0GV97_ACTMO|nr:glutathione/cysteine ABC transporter permease/ATP-binding protein [Actinopolyspora mortivallis]
MDTVLSGNGPLGGLPRLSPSTRRALLLAAVLAVANALALVAQAWALASVLADVVLRGLDLPQVSGRLAVLCGAVAARAVLHWATESVSARAAAGAKEELRALLLDSALRRGPEWIDRHGPSELTTLATKELDALDAYFTVYLPALVTAAVVPPLVGAGILLADPTSAVLVLLTVPLIPLFAWLVGRYTQGRTERAAEALQRMSGHLAELVRALPVLTAFGRARTQGEAVRRVSERHRRSSVATLRIAFLSALVLELCSSLSVALVAVGIGMRLVSGDMALETGLLVLVLAPECYLPLRAAGAAHHASEDGVEAVRRVERVHLDPPDTTVDGEQSAETPPEGAELSVTGLGVARRGRRVPDGLSFTARPGEMLRLDGFAGIGPSGSGKSTTFAVLLGFVTPEAGTVRYGGTEITELSSPRWRSLLSWIPQHPVFSGGTVEQELRLAVSDQPEGTAERLHRALTEADAEHLRGRPVDTLSAGERQRVAVARGLLRLHGRARVLLADEPTAHLDTTTASRVERALRRAAEAGAVVVMASHRPGSSPQEDEGTRATASTAPRLRERTGRARLGELVTARGLAGGGLAVLSLASGVALTATSAWLIARAAQQPPVLTLSVAAVGVRTFALSRSVLRYLERLITHDAAFRLAGRLRRGLWAGLVRLGPARAAGLSRGEGATRLVEDTDTVRDLAPRVFVPPVTAMGVGGAAVALQTALLPPAGLLLAVALLLAGILGPAAALAVQRRAAAALTEGRREVATRTRGLFEAAAELLACGAADGLRAELAERDAELAARCRRVAYGQGAAGAVVTLLMGGAVVGCAALAARAVARGELAAELAAVLALVPLAVTETVAGLPAAAQYWRPLRRAHRRLSPLLHTGPPESASGEDARPAPADPPASDGPEVVLDGVDVRWPGAAEPALREVSLRVPAGTHVAVVGESGQGKSTLLALLAGLLPPERGEVTAPGRVTWCPQDPQLVSTTVRENLRMADPRADDTRLAEALRCAGLAHWTGRLDELLGAGGTAASGGEARRLALARALVPDEPGLVLLDEPTAHLDPPTAEELSARLRDRLRGRTVVRVTHRESETADADVVWRVADGRIVAEPGGGPPGHAARDGNPPPVREGDRL